MTKPIHYFKNRTEWRSWLLENHAFSQGVYLIFFTVDSDFESMRWEEAVQEALCFGWIDSTVKKIGPEKRKQYFCPRKDKSVWSKLNKKYIDRLIKENLMHEAGLLKVETAIQNGSWEALDDVENLIIPIDLQKEFDKYPNAFNNYNAFSRTYKKNYLYWLNQAKREITRQKRVKEIISLCKQNIKSRTER